MKKKMKEGWKEHVLLKGRSRCQNHSQGFSFLVKSPPFYCLSLVFHACPSVRRIESSKYMQSLPVDPFISLHRDVLFFFLLFLSFSSSSSSSSSCLLRLSWHWTIVVVKVSPPFLSLIVIQVLPDTTRPSQCSFYILLFTSFYVSLWPLFSHVYSHEGRKSAQRKQQDSLLFNSYLNKRTTKTTESIDKRRIDNNTRRCGQQERSTGQQRSWLQGEITSEIRESKRMKPRECIRFCKKSIFRWQRLENRGLKKETRVDVTSLVKHVCVHHKLWYMFNLASARKIEHQKPRINYRKIDRSWESPQNAKKRKRYV